MKDASRKNMMSISGTISMRLCFDWSDDLTGFMAG